MLLFNCEFLYGIKKRSYKGYVKANTIEEAKDIILVDYPKLEKLELKEANCSNCSFLNPLLDKAAA